MTVPTFHADGSASPNPGAGGWAVVRGGKPVALGGEPDSTNIRMEGRAMIAALSLAGDRPAVIISDSQFWIDILTKWAKGWEARGWTKKDGKAVANPDLVKEAHALYRASKATLQWTRGHQGDPGNELADEWANRARTGERLAGPAAPSDEYLLDDWHRAATVAADAAAAYLASIDPPTSSAPRPLRTLHTAAEQYRTAKLTYLARSFKP